MTHYLLKCYWNSGWSPKISNPETHPLEPSLWNVDDPNNPILVLLPGIDGGNGFNSGDTIYFAFATSTAQLLTSVTIKFKQIETESQANPLAITGDSTSIWSKTWATFTLENGEQIVKDSQGSPFTFASENGLWVAAIEAVHTKLDGTTMKFAFDPEWKVGPN